MWEHPVAQENFAKLASLGYRFIGPESGWLACRNVGAGRLSEPQKIVDEVVNIMGTATTGPANEKRDQASRSI
jgi:phosphopantothenoylcysteine decarboxylase/phosphopantothenate--cysteine ligase